MIGLFTLLPFMKQELLDCEAKNVPRNVQANSDNAFEERHQNSTRE